MSQPQPNRQPGWERPLRTEPVFNLAGVVVAIIALCIGIHLLRVYVLDVWQDRSLLVRTAFVPIRYSGLVPLDIYSFTSPFTYTLLHGGAMHLIVNMVWLAAFGSPLAYRIGTVRFVLFFAATGVAAAALYWSFHPDDTAPLIGASGAISGMMGAAARFAFQIDRRGSKPSFSGPVLPIGTVFRSRMVVTFLAIWMIVNFVTGFYGMGSMIDGQIAWEAHIGGFLAGFLGIRVFDGENSDDFRAWR